MRPFGVEFRSGIALRVIALVEGWFFERRPVAGAELGARCFHQIGRTSTVGEGIACEFVVVEPRSASQHKVIQYFPLVLCVNAFIQG